MAPRERQNSFDFVNISDGKQILIVLKIILKNSYLSALYEKIYHIMVIMVDNGPQCKQQCVRSFTKIKNIIDHVQLSSTDFF